MMGRDTPPQRSLFYTGIDLDKRVRGDHVLRKVAGLVDFDFVYGEVKDSYGYNGNVSVAPPMILKLMLLLVLYNVRSERELMATLPERLDWLWFLGLDLDSEIPDHSVLSKARKRWGVELFRSFFERIVWQCVESGLVDGKKLFCDSSLVQGSRHSHLGSDLGDPLLRNSPRAHELSSFSPQATGPAAPHTERESQFVQLVNSVLLDLGGFSPERS